MFEAVDTSTARGPDGVTVEVVEDGLRYRRSERSLFVPLEYLYGENAVVVYESSIRSWEVANACEVIGTIERAQILAELGEALGALGVKYRIEA